MTGAIGMGVMLRQATVLTRRGRQAVLVGGEGVTAAALIAARGKLVTKADLIQRVWGGDPAGGPVTADRVLEQWVHRLRPKLAQLGLTVVTRRGFGWYVDTAPQVPR